MGRDNYEGWGVLLINSIQAVLTIYTASCKIIIMSERPGKQMGQWDQRKIQALRKHLGLTQQELSEKLGTRQQTISEWETGMYQPRGASATLLSIIAEQAKFKDEAGRPKERT